MKTPFLPHDMESQSARYMVVKRKHLSLIFMYYKLPWKLDIRAIQRQKLTLYPNLVVREFWTAVDFYSLEKYKGPVLEYYWDFPQNL